MGAAVPGTSEALQGRRRALDRGRIVTGIGLWLITAALIFSLLKLGVES